MGDNLTTPSGGGGESELPDAISYSGLPTLLEESPSLYPSQSGVEDEHTRPSLLITGLPSLGDVQLGISQQPSGATSEPAPIPVTASGSEPSPVTGRPSMWSRLKASRLASASSFLSPGPLMLPFSSQPSLLPSDVDLTQDAAGLKQGEGASTASLGSDPSLSIMGGVSKAGGRAVTFHPDAAPSPLQMPDPSRPYASAVRGIGAAAQAPNPLVRQSVLHSMAINTDKPSGNRSGSTLCCS